MGPRRCHAQGVNGESHVFHRLPWMQTRSISTNFLHTTDGVCIAPWRVPTKTKRRHGRMSRQTNRRAMRLQQGKSRVRWMRWRLVQPHRRRRRVGMRHRGRHRRGMDQRCRRRVKLLHRIRPRYSLLWAERRRALSHRPQSCLPIHHLQIEVGARRR